MSSKHPCFKAKRPSIRSITCRMAATPLICLSEASTTSQAITLLEIQEAAESRGLSITHKTLGPFFRVVCRVAGDEDESQTNVIGLGTGFYAPWFGILHFDELRIYNSRLKMLPSGSKARSTFGVGILLGGAAVSYGYEIGCRKAELLAIKDNEQCAQARPFPRCEAFAGRRVSALRHDVVKPRSQCTKHVPATLVLVIQTSGRKYLIGAAPRRSTNGRLVIAGESLTNTESPTGFPTDDAYD
ncbi:hypothetical protein CYMTET_51630 [Cymbomonas tetramitiformis]|uniref:Uncharacterized protein n=1 Tax=Cymbomonas tetramitiformis TaxID=36881 RepID=A0AAE0BM49_9CHLO|nr:hypothetical protein CYMTET_51630 [Cymbomonas tetramitiformis]